MIREQDIVRNHVLSNQSYVVGELIKSGAIPDESLNGEWYEVIEWWLVTPYLARLLADECEVIIEDCGCCWWGRQCSGQAIYLDEIMAQIVESFD